MFTYDKNEKPRTTCRPALDPEGSRPVSDSGESSGSSRDQGGMRIDTGLTWTYIVCDMHLHGPEEKTNRIASLATRATTHPPTQTHLKMVCTIGIYHSNCLP